MHFAATWGHVDVVKTLIEKGANKEVTSKWGWKPLNWAANQGHVEVVKMLLGKGANTKAVTKIGGTPLLLVARVAMMKQSRCCLKREPT